MSQRITSTSSGNAAPNTLEWDSDPEINQYLVEYHRKLEQLERRIRRMLHETSPTDKMAIIETVFDVLAEYSPDEGMYYNHFMVNYMLDHAKHLKERADEERTGQINGVANGGDHSTEV